MSKLLKRPLFALCSLLCLAGGMRAQAGTYNFDIIRANSDNLAFERPATQSSTNDNAVATLAVDGIIEGNLMKGSVTHTQDTNQPWWQVDLQRVALIGTVTIHNRTDCCKERLSNFSLLVSEDGSSWQEYSYPGTASEGVLFPVNRNGRYVKVQLNGQGILSLAEVVVTEQTNLAEGRLATQSTTNDNSVAALAVDGKSDGNFMKGSVTHTQDTNQPWWQVDLKNLSKVSFSIGSVILHNRTDCCGERLSNFKVLVSLDGTTWQEYPYPGTAPQQVEIPVNRIGRYVRVQLNGKGILSLAEVVVPVGQLRQSNLTLVDPIFTLAEFQAHVNGLSALAQAAKWEAQLAASQAAIAAEAAKPTAVYADSNVSLSRSLLVRWDHVKNPQGTEFARMVDSKGTQVASCNREDGGHPFDIGRCSMRVPKLGTYKVQLVRGDLTPLAETGPITVNMPGTADFSCFRSCFLLELQGTFVKARCRVPTRSSSVIAGVRVFAGHGLKDSSIADYTQCLDVSNNDGKLVCNKEYLGITIP